MADKFFIDTNILVYAHDSSSKEKQKVSQSLILKGIEAGMLVLSTQVLSEFFVTMTQKIKVPMTVSKAKEEIKLLQAAEIVEIDFDMILEAIEIKERYIISFWDSLIVASAQRGGCKELYSEDLNQGQFIKHVRIVNPYR